MRAKYNSADYWEKAIRHNNTLKAKMFIDEPITEKTVYIHYVIFNKKSGIESIWAPMPNIKTILGFIQYCFLPDAYYKWIVGREKVVAKMPTVSVEKILSMGVSSGKLTKEEIHNMREEIKTIKKMWSLPSDKLFRELRTFCRKFNNNWLGNSNEFLYIKIFRNAEELGEFISDTNIKTDFQEKFESQINLSNDEWTDLYKNVNESKESQERFKDILLKELSEII